MCIWKGCLEVGIDDALAEKQEAEWLGKGLK